MNQISLFKPGALVWLPAETKRFRWSDDLQLELFPKEYSITKIPLIGVLKGYTDRGDCEVLFQDGIWNIESKDVKDYEDSPSQRRRNDRVSTNKKN
tara:strand:- start:889 stop:1176 length:288 start_codon:yes stop_codon:yes gene_type:complete